MWLVSTGGDCEAEDGPRSQVHPGAQVPRQDQPAGEGEIHGGERQHSSHGNIIDSCSSSTLINCARRTSDCFPSLCY